MTGGGGNGGPRVGKITRRQLLKAGAAAGVAGTLGTLGRGLSSPQGRLIEKALAGSASARSLSDIKHVVVLMQENRSFDHYFGTMQGVRGYRDLAAYRSYAGGPTTSPGTLAAPGPVFAQTMVGSSIVPGKSADYALADGATVLEPFELVSTPPTVAGQTTNDITHDWGPQHGAWDDGAMDRFMVEHLANDPTALWQLNTTDGIPVPARSKVSTGITAMGYYRPGDCLAFYRALADAFTICDGYHCSVLGPTDPNRLMWMTGSLGAHSADVGGPVLETYVTNREKLYGTLDWPTVPELLTDSGVSWKVYQDPSANLFFNVLTYFKNFVKPSTTTEVENAALGLAPVYPAEFEADVAAGTLPAVSFVLPPLYACEHPATPAEYGEWLVSQILQTLVSNPEVWATTVFLVIYDENGGFFDHVSPPTPGPLVTSVGGIPSTAASLYAGGLATASSTTYSTDGEYVTTASPSNAAGGPPSDWAGVLGPVGLGFRTPALVISPLSAGGWVCSDVFDHISAIKLIETLFLSPGTVQAGLHVSDWRYATVGDMTAALPNTTPVTAVPGLPATSLLYPETASQAVLDALSGTEDDGPAYPPPPANTTDYQTQDAEPAGFSRRPADATSS
jgi:phospholipase C